jgi:FkbM family methyltransferase
MFKTSLILRGVKKITFLKKYVQHLVRQKVLGQKSIKRLNKTYQKLSYSELKEFHTLFSKIFKSGKYPDFDAEWVITFANIEIRMPLQGKSLWLDWDTALSIKGHDVEIKRVYEKLILSDNKPSAFFDIGANYGTHSILFLANGIRTVTFEPNPLCYVDFDRIAALNKLTYHLEKVALGHEKSHATLQFPERDTWLGSLSNETQKNLQGYNNVRSIEVDVITLDSYVKQNNILPDLIKIDTEGFELNVIRGAKKLLMENEIIVIFESTHGNQRNQLFDEFMGLGYKIFNLKKLHENSLTRENFLSCNNNNYLAMKPTHPVNDILSTFA